MPYETCGKVTTLCSWCGGPMQDGDRSSMASVCCEPCVKTWNLDLFNQIRDQTVRGEVSDNPTGGAAVPPKTP